MKKYISILLAAALAACLWGCGRRNEDPTTDTQAPETQAPATTAPTVTLPDPTLDTNIPDPTVNSNSTEDGSLMDDITEMTEDKK